MALIAEEGSINLQKVDMELLRLIGYYFGLKGLATVKSRDRIISKLNEKANASENDFFIPTYQELKTYNLNRREKRIDFLKSKGEVPDESEFSKIKMIDDMIDKLMIKDLKYDNNIPESKPTVTEIKKTNGVKVNIRKEPRRKVIVMSSNSEDTWDSFSVNDYTVLITFGKEIMLPLTMINFIKSLEAPRFIKSADGGLKKIVSKKYYVETL